MLLVGLAALSVIALASRAERSPGPSAASKARSRVIAKTGALAQAVHLRLLTDPEYSRLSLPIRHEMAISSMRMLEVPIPVGVPFDPAADAVDYAAVIVGEVPEGDLRSFESLIDRLIESFVERGLLARALEDISAGAPLPAGPERATARTPGP